MQIIQACLHHLGTKTLATLVSNLWSQQVVGAHKARTRSDEPCFLPVCLVHSLSPTGSFPPSLPSLEALHRWEGAQHPHVEGMPLSFNCYRLLESAIKFSSE